MKIIPIQNDDNPVETKHIGWYVKEVCESHPFLVLIEIVENKYIHPDSEGMSTLSMIEEVIHDEVKGGSAEYDAIKLLKIHLDLINKLMKREPQGKA